MFLRFSPLYGALCFFQMNKELKRRGELIESLKSEEKEASKKSEETSAAAVEEAVALRAKVEELQRELGDRAKKGRFGYDVR